MKMKIHISISTLFLLCCIFSINLSASTTYIKPLNYNRMQVQPDSVLFVFSSKGLIISQEILNRGNQIREVIKFTDDEVFHLLGFYSPDQEFTGYRANKGSKDGFALRYFRNGNSVDLVEDDLRKTNADLSGRIKALIPKKTQFSIEKLNLLIASYLVVSNIEEDTLAEKEEETSEEGIEIHVPDNSKELKILSEHLITLAQHVLWLYQYKQLEADLNNLKPRIEVLSGSQFDDIREQASLFKTKLQNPNNPEEADIREFLIAGTRLIKEVNELEIILKEKEAAFIEYTEIVTSIGKKLENNFPLIYQTEFSNLNTPKAIERESNERENSLGDRITFIQNYESLLDSLIIKKHDISILWKELSQILGDENDIKNSNISLYPIFEKEAFEKCERLICLKEKSDELQRKIEQIQQTDQEVKFYASLFNGDLSRLGDKYLQFYPTIYKKELKPLIEKREDFKKSNDLIEKHRIGKLLSDTIPYYENSLLLFASIDSLIDFQFPELKNRLSKMDKTIYKGEIPAIENSIKSYKIGNTVALKKIAGIDCKEKIEHTEMLFNSFTTQSGSIEKSLSDVSAKYEKDFLPLYKGEIKGLEKKYSHYISISQLQARMETGEALIEEINRYDSLYHELSYQSKLLVEKVLQSELLYQTAFPRIFKEELSEQRKDIKTYESMSDIYSKALKGSFIIELAESMISAHPIIVKNEERIKLEFDQMFTAYKKEYPEVYKTKIEPILGTVKEYESAGFHQKKLVLGNEIVETIEENTSRLNELRRTSEIITERINEFHAFFQNKRQFKNIYKRGKKTAQELKKSFDKEINPDIKLEKGVALINIMDKFISLRTGYHDELETSMKKAKTTEDVVQLLQNYLIQD